MSARVGLTLTRTPPERSEILDLAATLERADGAPPLSDQAITRLDDASLTHLSVRDGDALVGYAQLDGDSLEIAALDAAVPSLLDAVGSEPGSGTLLVWSHGRRSRLVPALEAGGFARERELHQLRRPMDAAHPLPADPELPADLTVRAFVPGRDDEAWLALNAAAFAHHPEQGGWTSRDLQARMSESWFDPAGFLLAERGGELLGFHWTKIHPDTLGEVYVLGVAPDAQGLGLGRALLIRGLRHLADRGCPAVLLYVDGDNTPAMKLYAKDAFATYDLDVQWRRHGDS